MQGETIFNGMPRNSPLLIHRYTHKPFNYLDHAIENTLANTIMATYAWSMMGRLGVI